MRSKFLNTILKTLPHTRYHSTWHVFTWHPRGVLDDELADEIVGVIESEEFFEEAPFNRYTDFSGLANIHLKVGHLFQIAEHRHEVSEVVKSAFYAETVVGLSLARMYQFLMKGGAIQVR